MDNRYRGALNRANGEQFERIIDTACDAFRREGIALIEKTPEPMHPIRNMGAGKFLAVFRKKAQPDYKGMWIGGQTILFEAKYTETGVMLQNRVTKEQAEQLEQAWSWGAEVFVLCSFGNTRFFRIPWEVWREMKERYGAKKVTPEQIPEYEVKMDKQLILRFL